VLRHFAHRRPHLHKQTVQRKENIAVTSSS
jgi:hypothetical protein